MRPEYPIPRGLPDVSRLLDELEGEKVSVLAGGTDLISGLRSRIKETEPSLFPTAPAIVDAIQDAVGVRVMDVPATPGKILIRALTDRRDEGATLTRRST